MLWFRVGAISGALAVLTGAFGSHALKARASPRDLEIWETAVKYQMYHGIAIMVGAAAAASNNRLNGSHYFPLSMKLFAIGTVLFSGSLYTLVLTQQKRLGAITPIGGISLVAGWITLALSV